MEGMPTSMLWILDCRILGETRPMRFRMLYWTKSNMYSDTSHGPHDLTNPATTCQTQSHQFHRKTSHLSNMNTHWMPSHELLWQKGGSGCVQGACIWQMPSSQFPPALFLCWESQLSTPSNYQMTNQSLIALTVRRLAMRTWDVHCWNAYAPISTSPLLRITAVNPEHS